MKNSFRTSKIILVLVTVLMACTGFAQVNTENIPENADKIVELAGEILKKTVEIQPLFKFRTAAQDYETTFFAYGGTALELLEFARARVKELGSIEMTRAWLNEPSTQIELIKWHKPTSDLDFIFLDDSDIRESRGSTGNYRNLIVGNGLFYDGGDLTHISDFFDSYNPEREHFEPISNIGFDVNGTLFDAEAQNVRIQDKEVKLSSLGLQDFLKRTLTFIYNPDGPRTPVLVLKQYLRWLRLIVEHPDWAVSKESDASIEILRKQITQPENFEYFKGILLKVVSRTEPKDETEKIIFKVIPKNIEKVFGGKKPTVSIEILRKYGLIDFLEKMGPDVSLNFMRDILPHREPVNSGDQLGQSMTVYMKVPISQIRGLENGIPWIANNGVALMGYLKASTKTRLGQILIPVTISGDAILNTDIKIQKEAGTVLIKTENAFQLNSRGGVAQAFVSARDLVFSQLKAFSSSISKSNLTDESIENLFVLWRIIAKEKEYESYASYFIQKVSEIADLKLSFRIVFPFAADTRLKLFNSLASDRLKKQILDLWNSTMSQMDLKSELGVHDKLDRWRFAERTIVAMHRWPDRFPQHAILIKKILEIDKLYVEETGAQRRLHLKIIEGDNIHRLTKDDLRSFASFPELLADIRPALKSDPEKSDAFDQITKSKSSASPLQDPAKTCGNLLGGE